MSLTPCQKYAVDKFSKQKVAALFMEMGTGKTLTALTLANLHADRYDLLLWMAPVSTLNNAKEEIELRGGAKNPIIYKGYESIASSDRIYLELLDELKGKRIFLVCDESLFLKNGNTIRWRRVDHIRRMFAEFCILLNGTPMSRDEMDIFWQMRLLSPIILGLTPNEYQSALFTKVTVKRPSHSTKTFYKRCKTNIPWLKSRISPYVYECDLSIPVILEEIDNPIRVSEYVRAKYVEQKRELLSAVANDDEYAILGALSKMKCTVACDWMKNDAIAKEIVDKKVIVFCEYRDELDRIVSKTKNGAFAIDGDTPIKKRSEIIAQWKAGQKPLVTMTACSGYGLNLQEADEVIFASLPWDYAAYTQALHRAFRLGQKAKVLPLKKYTQRIGISRMVEECLWKKTTMAKYVKEIDWRNYGI